MKKFFKILLVLVIILIVLAVIAAFALKTFIDPNRYKEQISSNFKKATGRDLVINGPIEDSVFPWLGVRIHQVRISNAPGFQPQDTFLQVGEADVRVKLLPLFSKRIEIGTVILKDVIANLAKNKQGQTNFEDLLKKNNAQRSSDQQSTTTTVTTPPNSSSETNKISKSFQFKEISLAGVVIDNANVHWVDEQKNQDVQISNLQLKAENISETKPFILSLQYNLQNNAPGGLSGHFSFNGKVSFNQQQDTITFESPRFGGQFSGKKWPDMALTADNIVVGFKPFSAALTNATLQAGSLNAQLNLQATSTLGKLNYQGHIVIPEFNLKNFLQSMDKPVHTEDPAALQRAALTADVTGTSNSVQLTNMQGHIDDSAWQGRVVVSDISKWVMSIDLGINQLNLDRYLPPKSTPANDSKPITPVTATTAVATKQSPSNYAALRKATVTGAVQISTLTIAETHLTDVYARFALINGTAQIIPLRAKAYQGSSEGQVRIDFQGNTPRYTLDEKLSNIQINQLTRSDKLTGTADVNTHLILQGEGKEAMLRSLDGTLQLNVKNGAMLGINVPYELQRIKALVRKEPIPAKPADNKTDFGVFNASGIFKNGVFSNNDLLIDSDQFKITGHGTANLVSQGLDYHLNAAGKQSGVVRENNLQIPIQVTGTFSKPIITPDLRALAEELLKGSVGQRLQERLLGAPAGGEHPLIRGRAGQLLHQFLQ